MHFQTPLVPARLIRRYKRFLADIVPEEGPDAGREVTAHCANPGAMLGLAEPGVRIWVEPNDDPRKKLRYGWRLVDHENGHFTGVDTSVPNRALREALIARRIPDLADYAEILPEQRYAEKSRIDFLLRGPGRADFYLEIKAVTLSRTPGCAEFPDCVTTRGARHMDDLADMVRAGHRAMVLFLVQRSDAERVSLAGDLDPGYVARFDAARQAGVEVLCLSTRMSPQAIVAGGPLPFDHPRRFPAVPDA